MPTIKYLNGVLSLVNVEFLVRGFPKTSYTGHNSTFDTLFSSLLYTLGNSAYSAYVKGLQKLSVCVCANLSTTTLAATRLICKLKLGQCKVL